MGKIDAHSLKIKMMALNFNLKVYPHQCTPQFLLGVTYSKLYIYKECKKKSSFLKGIHMCKMIIPWDFFLKRQIVVEDDMLLMDDTYHLHEFQKCHKKANW